MIFPFQLSSSVFVTWALHSVPDLIASPIHESDLNQQASSRYFHSRKWRKHETWQHHQPLKETQSWAYVEGTCSIKICTFIIFRQWKRKPSSHFLVLQLLYDVFKLKGVHQAMNFCGCFFFSSKDLFRNPLSLRSAVYKRKHPQRLDTCPQRLCSYCL